MLLVRRIEDRFQKILEVVRPTDIPRRHVPSPLHICPLFRQKHRFGAARVGQPGGIPYFFDLPGEMRGHLSWCRKFLHSNSILRLTLREVLPLGLGPDGTITVGAKFKSAPASETGPVLLDNLRFMLIRHDSGNSCRCGKSLF